MIHGALFRTNIANTGEPALNPVDGLDGSVRKMLGQEEAYLVGVSAFGPDLQYVKITNDLWNEKEYLYVPALGTQSSGSIIWWLPSPMRVTGDSKWTVTANQSGGGLQYENVILYLSYGPIASESLRGGIISRKVTGEPGTPVDEFHSIDTISDLDPKRNYLLIGGVGISTYTIAIRVKSDSFRGIFPVFPGVDDVAKGLGRMLNLLPEGTPLSGKEVVTVEALQSSAESVDAYLFFAQSEVR